MTEHRPSSRARFETYRESLKDPDSSARPQDRGRRRRERSSRVLLKGFYEQLEGYRGTIAFAMGTLTVATLLALIPPATTKFAIDYVLTGEPLPSQAPSWVPREPWPLLLCIVGGVLAISLVRMAIHVWGRWHATRVNKLLQVAVRKRALEHALRLPLYRAQELKSGGIVSILREDANSVGDLVFSMLYNPWRAVIQLVGSLAVLAWVDWRLLIGAGVLIPLVFLAHRTWIGRIRPQHRRIRAQREEVDGQATEAFGGIRVVRGFSRQRAETDRLMRGHHLMTRQQLFAWWWARIVEIAWQVMMPVATSGMLLYGGWQVLEGNLTLGDLMMFLVYVMMLLGPIATLAQSATDFQSSLSGLDRILDLLEEPREMASEDPVEFLRKTDVAGRVTFEDVNFSYPGADRFALEGISLDVDAGETIALVGPSGSGKTTVCNLVARFYDPTSGRLLLDGRDLREFDAESFRESIGIVEQDVFLFDGTVASNIAYGDQRASREQIVAAARMANADEFIDELSHGYDSIIGERGVKLSGGQRQRIAIARAVLANPRILILDEATSNLDTQSERLIQDSLTELMSGRTCFVIAHRLSTIRHADRIVVLENSRVIEMGTHDELIASNSRYADMVALQTSLSERLLTN